MFTLSEFDHDADDTLQVAKVKGKQRNVSAAKRYITGTDRLTEFDLGMGVVIDDDDAQTCKARPK